MRFAIATLDRYLGIFEAFCLAGWTPTKLFTLPVRDPEFGTQARAIALAEKTGATVQLSRLSDADLSALGESGCEVLIVAGYDWKIPPWERALKYAVNFHPAPLPIGRGPYPLPRALLEQRPFWGMTCHRLSAQFDAGDILAAEHFALHADECHERLNLRVQMAGKRLAIRVARNFVTLWVAHGRKTAAVTGRAPRSANASSISRSRTPRCCAKCGPMVGPGASRMCMARGSSSNTRWPGRKCIGNYRARLPIWPGSRSSSPSPTVTSHSWKARSRRRTWPPNWRLPQACREASAPRVPHAHPDALMEPAEFTVPS